MKPLVSIIIPVFNAEKYLSQTINSALNQTWTNKEIIIIDDGSDDASFNIAKLYESENVKIFRQKNQGASAARNLGIKEAKGKFIQFLDADDLLKNNKIESQLNTINFSCNQLAICPVIHFLDGNSVENILPLAHEKVFYQSNANPFNFLLKLYGSVNNQTGMIALHSWLTPIGLIKKVGFWNENLTVNDDGEYFCRVVLASEKIIYTDETFCYYRKYKTWHSLSAQKNSKALQSQFDSIILIHQHLHQYKNPLLINPIIAALLKQLEVNIYPSENVLSKAIKQKITEMGGTKYVPVLGGKLIEVIKDIAGWKVARLLQHIIMRLKHKSGNNV